MATNATWQWKSNINLWQKVNGTETSPYVDIDVESVLQTDWNAYQTFLNNLKTSDPIAYYEYMISCVYEWTQRKVQPTFALVYPDSVAGSPKVISVEVGKTAQAGASYVPSDVSDPTVTYKSGNTAYFTVDSSGVVTGVAVGTAMLTVTVMGVSANSEVTVTAAS